MKPNKYDYVLSLFTSQDEMRPAFATPFPQETFYCATDSHSLIVVQNNLPGLKYEGHEKAPNALGLYKNHTSDTEFSLTKEEFMEGFFSAEFRFMHSMKKCHKCDGKGYKECHCCGNESDCEECDGSGEDFEQIPFGKPFLHGELVRFAETTFYPNSLNKILIASNILGVDKIIVKYEKDQKYKSRVFYLGDVRILLMPSIKN